MSQVDPPLNPEWLNDRSEFQQNFVHGLRNPIGLHIQYQLDGGIVRAEWTADDRHVGFPGFVHGGLIAAILDDAMGRSTALLRRWMVTGRHTTRYRGPAPVGAPLRIEAEMTRVQRRLVTARSSMALTDDTPIADAEATYLPIPDDLRHRMVAAWPGFEEYI